MSTDTLSTTSDIVIIGAGIAGLIAAREAVKNNLTYTIIESNDSNWLGGRVHTESINLDAYNTPELNGVYKFEWGGAWLHGLEESKTLDLLNQLCDQYYWNGDFNSPKPSSTIKDQSGLQNTDISNDNKINDNIAETSAVSSVFCQRQLFQVFQGCAWLLSEYLPFDQIVLFDSNTKTLLTQFHYTLYLVITSIHLRGLLRKYPHLDLGLFAQLYVNWIEDVLVDYTFAITEDDFMNLTQLNNGELTNNNGINNDITNTITPDIGTDELTNQNIASIVARAVGWYFHSVEGYHGVAISDMQAKDMFYPLTDTVYGDIACNDEALNDYERISSEILNLDEKKALFDLISSWLLKSFADHTSQPPDTCCKINQKIEFVDISHELVSRYQNSKYSDLDTETHGCYKGPHCVLKCGMSVLVKLLVQDIEALSGAELNIHYNSTATRIGSDIKGMRATKYNTVYCSNTNDDDNGENINNSGEGAKFVANRGIVLTGSIPSLVKRIEFDPFSCPTNHQDGEDCDEADQDDQVDTDHTKPLNTIISTLEETTMSVYYKKVAFCFPHVWWPRPKTTRVVGILQYYTDMTQCNLDSQSEQEHTDDNDQQPRDFSEGNGYDSLFKTILQGIQSNVGESNTFTTTKFPPVNLLFESHYPSKSTPVLSASLVGNLAHRLSQPLLNGEISHANDDWKTVNDDIAKTITLSSLQSLYSSINSSNPSPLPSTSTVETQLPTPLFTRITQWGEEPSFSHSYSLITDPTIGTTSRISIAAKHGIFFTGEGIDVYDTGSIHAAITTAETAIQYVIDGVEEMIEEEEWTEVE